MHLELPLPANPSKHCPFGKGILQALHHNPQKGEKKKKRQIDSMSHTLKESSALYKAVLVIFRPGLQQTGDLRSLGLLPSLRAAVLHCSNLPTAGNPAEVPCSTKTNTKSRQPLLHPHPHTRSEPQTCARQHGSPAGSRRRDGSCYILRSWEKQPRCFGCFSAW